MDALNVDSDDFGMDEPSKLVPIPTPSKNPHKQTQLGYSCRRDIAHQEEPRGAGTPVCLAKPKQVDMAPPLMLSLKQNPLSVRPWYTLGGPTRNSGCAQGPSQRWEPLPSLTPVRYEKKPWALYIAIAGVLLIGGAAAYILTTGEKAAPAVIALSHAEALSEQADVFVSGIQMNASASILTVEEGPLRARRLGDSKSGKGAVNFTLPVIVESASWSSYMTEADRFRAFSGKGHDKSLH